MSYPELDLSDLIRDFGDPNALPEWETKTPKTFEDGARCDLNPNCIKVNTKRCDPARCQKATIRRAQSVD